MYADQCLVGCQRLNVESVHSSQLSRPSPSNLMVKGVAVLFHVLEHDVSHVGPEAICLVLFEAWSFLERKFIIKLIPKKKAVLFCPHLKSIKHTKHLFHYATSRKVAGSIPEGFIKFFIDVILLTSLLPWGRLSL
jgi:hypothetical protein